MGRGSPSRSGSRSRSGSNRSSSGSNRSRNSNNRSRSGVINNTNRNVLAYPTEYKSFNNRTTKDNGSLQEYIYLFRDIRKLQSTVFYGLSKRGIQSYIKPDMAQYVQYKLQ